MRVGRLVKPIFILIVLVASVGGAENQIATSRPVVDAKTEKAAETSESREVVIDPTQDTYLPGQRFNQSPSVQFHNQVDERLRLQSEATMRRLDRVGRNRE